VFIPGPSKEFLLLLFKTPFGLLKISHMKKCCIIVKPQKIPSIKGKKIKAGAR
jgi:hypothetical protein